MKISYPGQPELTRPVLMFGFQKPLEIWKFKSPGKLSKMENIDESQKICSKYNIFSDIVSWYCVSGIAEVTLGNNCLLAWSNFIEQVSTLIFFWISNWINTTPTAQQWHRGNQTELKMQQSQNRSEVFSRDSRTHSLSFFIKQLDKNAFSHPFKSFYLMTDLKNDLGISF